jgi:multicomponent K+:H+ antiporter subunit A
MSLVLILALPFAGSVIAALLPSNAHKVEAWLAGAVAVVCAVLIALQVPAVLDGQVVRASASWIPALGIDFTLRMDAYAWLFAMIVASMGALIVLYARYYLSPQDPVPRFFAFFQAFMGSMLGVVLSGNLIQLVVFWELTSLVPPSRRPPRRPHVAGHHRHGRPGAAGGRAHARPCGGQL